MNLTSRLLAFGLTGSAAVAVCSCSSSTPTEPSATSLAASATSAARTASSVHVDGSVSDNGSPVGLNLGINRAGDMSGTITEHGANLNVISTSGKVFVKVTPGLLQQYKAPSAVCKLVCGKWFQLPPQQAKQLTSQLTMNNLTGQAGANPGSSQAKVTKAGTGTVNGTPTWVLKGPTGAKVDVSQNSKHYPLQVQSGTGQQGKILYSQWNAVPQPKAPPSSSVINLNDLQNGH
jgi:hypothetical protein